MPKIGKAHSDGHASPGMMVCGRMTEKLVYQPNGARPVELA